MSEFKGTPAPWSLAKGQQDMVVGGGKIIAATYADNWVENACLITAAPDLLAALQFVLPWLPSTDEEALHMAETAIKKALGK